MGRRPEVGEVFVTHVPTGTFHDRMRERARPLPTYTEGERVSRVTLLTPTTTAGVAAWFCLCDCGATVVLSVPRLAAPRLTSCGCRGLKVKRRVWRSEFIAWRGMIARCSDANNVDYGGRGIRVCDEWLASFDAFLAHIGPKPVADLSVDRIRVNGHYEPWNVRWATSTVQNRNRRCNVIRTRSDGRSQCHSAWAEELGITPGALTYRIKQWGIERALTTPRRAA